MCHATGRTSLGSDTYDASIDRRVDKGDSDDGEKPPPPGLFIALVIGPVCGVHALGVVWFDCKQQIFGTSVEALTGRCSDSVCIIL